MKAKEIREKSLPEIEKIFLEKKAELCQARFDMVARQLKNNQTIKTIRKDIARLSTVIAQSKDKKVSR